MQASDDFNRANGPLGPNWIDAQNAGGITIVSNTAQSLASNNAYAIWATGSFGKNQSAEVTIGNVPPFGELGVIVRAKNILSGFQGYLFAWTNGALFAYRLIPSDALFLNDWAVTQPSPGDRLRISAMDMVISCFLNDVLVGQVADTFCVDGNPGIHLGNFNQPPVNSIDSWTATDLGPDQYGGFVSSPG